MENLRSIHVIPFYTPARRRHHGQFHIENFPMTSEIGSPIPVEGKIRLSRMFLSLSLSELKDGKLITPMTTHTATLIRPGVSI